MESRRKAQLYLLAELATLKLPLFLMGGFAEDALLAHEITRERADVDFLMEEASWDSVRAQLHALGFVAFAPRFAAPDGRALAFVSHHGELEVEVWLCKHGPLGYAIILPGGNAADGSPTFFRLLLNADTFLFPATTLEGVAVQTISPQALTLFRAASAQTRGDAQRRSADVEMVERLSKQFLSGYDPADLVPQITKLG